LQYNGTVYVFGGQGPQNQYFTTVESLDLSLPQSNWVQRPAMKHGMTFMSVVLYACQMYIMGGTLPEGKKITDTNQVLVR